MTNVPVRIHAHVGLDMFSVHLASRRCGCYKPTAVAHGVQRVRG